MYNREIIGQLVDFISSKDGRTDKSRLQNEVQEAFGLVKDRSVYYCDWFAIRFCKAASRSFGNTVLALSALHRAVCSAGKEEQHPHGADPLCPQRACQGGLCRCT